MPTKGLNLDVVRFPGMSYSISTRYYYYDPEVGYVPYWNTVNGGTGPHDEFTRRVDVSWQNTPNYRELVKAGVRLPDYAYTRQTTWYAPSRHSFGYSVDGYYWNMSETLFIGGLPPLLTTDIGYDTSRMNSLLITRAKGQQWNAPIFLAELSKTATMVKERASQLARLAFYCYRGNLKRFFSELHKDFNKTAQTKARKRYGRDLITNGREVAAANLWLETRYGWRPFIKDVADAVETLQDTMDTPNRLVGRVTAKLPVRYENSRPWVNYSTSVGTWGAPCVLNAFVFHEINARAVWSFAFNPQDLPGRFGLLNPLEVAWELTPFSFVADWFLPIGSYLSSFDVPWRFTHVGGSYGWKFITHQQSYYTIAPGFVAWSGGAVGKSVRETIRRYAMTSLPTLEIADWRFKNPLGLEIEQALSAVALLRQAMTKFTLK